jgi:hypothetical protein
MAELSDVRLQRYLDDDLDDDFDFSALGDNGFGGFQYSRAFNPVGQGGLFGSVLKLGKGLLGKARGILKGGSSKASRAAKALQKAAATPTGRKVVSAGKQVITAAAGGGAVALLPTPGAQVVNIPASSSGGGARGSSIMVDGNGVAWRRAGRPVLWSGDLAAVKRVHKAAARARRASGPRRSVRRRA